MPYGRNRRGRADVDRRVQSLGPVIELGELDGMHGSRPQPAARAVKQGPEKGPS